jgi:hypothetical protein
VVAPTPRPTANPSGRSSTGSWLALLILLGAGGWAGWHGWLAWQDCQRDLTADADQRVEALAERLSALRTDQRVQAQRLQQAEATNRVLREELLGACSADGIQGFLPSREMCTDNAAMIAAAGWHRLRSDGPSSLGAGAVPNLRLPVVA